jgi:hypothetical protein
VTLHEVCRSLRINNIVWLPGSAGSSVDQQQQMLRQCWSWSAFGWLLRNLEFPLVRAYFFVTEIK